MAIRHRYRNKVRPGSKFDRWWDSLTTGATWRLHPTKGWRRESRGQGKTR